MTRLPIVGWCALILTLGVPIRADEFQARIRGGTIDARPSANLSGQVAISGTKGLTFAATFDDNGDTSANCAPCQAGETISLSGWVAGGFFGSATFRGDSYTFTSFEGGGQISFVGPTFTLPTPSTQERHTVEFQTPFTTTPESFLTLPGPNGTLGDTVRLSGSGTGTATFTVIYDEDLQNHLYFFEGLRLVFDKK